MYTARIRRPANPDFCKAGLGSSVGQGVPARHLGPPARAVRSEDAEVHADQHLLPDPSRAVRLRQEQHAVGRARAARSSGVVGWLNSTMFDETGDEQKSQGWTPFILDTNGNGKRDEYTEPNQPVDPSQGPPHQRGVLRRRAEPGRRLGVGLLARLSGRHRPPRPASRTRRRPRSRKSTRSRRPGYGPRGMDIDIQGRGLDAALERPSGELRPPQVQGPQRADDRDGKHCPEGWTLYPLPGPQVRGRARARERRGELLHLGRPARHARPRQGHADRHRQRERVRCSRSRTARWSTSRARIRWASTPRGSTAASTTRTRGWKGRGIWTTAGNRTPFHVEGGKGNLPKVVKFQLRPDPLAH